MYKRQSSGRSTEVISQKISEAFDNAAQDIPTLKGKSLTAKELLFSDPVSYTHLDVYKRQAYGFYSDVLSSVLYV